MPVPPTRPSCRVTPEPTGWRSPGVGYRAAQSRAAQSRAAQNRAAQYRAPGVSRSAFVVVRATPTAGHVPALAVRAPVHLEVGAGIALAFVGRVPRIVPGGVAHLGLPVPSPVGGRDGEGPVTGSLASHSTTGWLSSEQPRPSGPGSALSPRALGASCRARRGSRGPAIPAHWPSLVSPGGSRAAGRYARSRCR